MVHIRTSIVIRRPQEETFDYLTDLRNAKEWATELVDVAYDGELRVGATGVDTRRRGSKEFRLPWTVTAYRRPDRVVLEWAAGCRHRRIHVPARASQGRASAATPIFGPADSGGC